MAPEPGPRQRHTLHLTKYMFAARYIHGLVLDLACGPGYGSKLLWQEGHTQVIGVDLSTEIVRYAVASYPGPSFVIADGEKLPFFAGTFSSAVCLETLEHVSRPEVLLQELHRVLRPGGRLVLSTPNYIGNGFLSRAHRREFTHDDLESLLSAVFKPNITWFGQFDAPKRGPTLRILRGILDRAVARDQSNLRFKVLPPLIRDAVLRYALGVRGDPDDILPWKPNCLYQIAVLEKEAQTS